MPKMNKKVVGRDKIHLRLRNLLAAFHRILPTLQLAELSSRIREIPDERTLRFYTTAGLLAPPLFFDGRRALYGRFHLLQLLAVKRLQSQGQPLRNIQALVQNASPARLAAIANVDHHLINKALEEAAKDSSINLWPRGGGPEEAPIKSVPATLTTTVHTYRIGDGIYLTVDRAQAGTATEDIRLKLEKFTRDFASPPHQGRA